MMLSEAAVEEGRRSAPTRAARRVVSRDFGLLLPWKDFVLEGLMIVSMAGCKSLL